MLWGSENGMNVRVEDAVFGSQRSAGCELAGCLAEYGGLGQAGCISGEHGG